MVKTNITITLVNDKNESIVLTEEEARSAYLKLKELFEKNTSIDWTYFFKQPKTVPEIQINDLPYWKKTWTEDNSGSYGKTTTYSTANSITVKVS